MARVRWHWSDFGRVLLETGDLDPLYIILHKTNWLKKDPRLLKRWCFAYWCFYHPGLCCRITEAEDYWGAFGEALSGPRGAERRNFRGDKAREAIRAYQFISDRPEHIVDLIFRDRPTFQYVSKRLRDLPLFGPGIAWKIADMGERVLGYDVNFSNTDLQMCRDSVKGAEIIGGPLGLNIPQTVDHLLKFYAEYKAPPSYNRPVNIQEIGTILYKYKAHCNGSYSVGKGTRGVKQKLYSWGKIAEKLRKTPIL